MEDEFSDFTKVHILTNQFEADVLADALRQSEIPVLVRPFRETAYAEIFVPQKGWGWLMVPKDFEKKAKSVIQSALEAFENRPLYTDPMEIDPHLWQELRDADPQVVCANAKVTLHAEQSSYRIPFFTTHLLCFPQEETIEIEDPSIYPVLDFELFLVTLHYLLKAQPLEPTGKWISEKELPGGEQFFRNLHQFPVEPLMDALGSHMDLLENTARRLGGTPVAMGDRAYAFSVFPKVPVALLLWKGDEEFSPSVHLRFDETVHAQLAQLDVIWALGNVACEALHHGAQNALTHE